MIAGEDSRTEKQVGEYDGFSIYSPIDQGVPNTDQVTYHQT